VGDEEGGGGREGEVGDEEGGGGREGGGLRTCFSCLGAVEADGLFFRGACLKKEELERCD